MSTESVRVALSDAVDSIAGLRCTPYKTGQINPPQAMIDYEVNYDLTFGRGGDTYAFKIVVFDQITSERSAQIRLDLWRDGSDASSVKSVVEADTGLAAVCDYARVTSASDIRLSSIGGVDYLSVEFSVEVVMSG